MSDKSFLSTMRSMGKEFYLLSLMLYFFFISWAGCYSLLAVWLKEFFKLSGSEIGFAYAVFSVTALCLSPVYGMIQDRLILRRNLLAFVGILMALAGPYYIFIVEPALERSVILGGVAIGIFMGFTFNAGVGALESYTERFGRVAGFEFGFARTFGALGWASAVAVTGILININPHYNFIISSIAGIIFLILLFMLNSAKDYSKKMLDNYQESAQSKASFSEIGRLARMGSFWAVIVYVLGASIYGVYDQQFMVYFVSKFEDAAEGTRMYGFLNSTQVFLEAACTFAAPFVVNKIGAKNGLIVAGCIMFVRIGGSGLVDSPWAISAVKLLHAPEVPMVLISFFKYITTRFNPALSATVYLVAFVMIGQIIGAALAPAAGYLYDTIGFSQTYLMMSALVAVTTVLSIFLLTSKTLEGTSEKSIK
ncbi:MULTISPECIES: oligosaccharide MFS transporter [unclassified Anaerobiospirillum]|uniref:oligosaccharide MFS transporter n=1 Tax=unclassified Anaerobiospirillum TaxID=2647410 RepID=UPI001FF628EF|nr:MULTISPECIES: oligosaccharide MFS transporter [unclassified Anaerobiospirillum]MCK0527145.1 oligosaccharide MFS transporter [Anaerobiospirillum sp. NML120449]MCK0534830.1 oligosaccharide MFS transporter [Anaerobiospirillum sp. NML120511]MCK0540150.1 oligosaccharide MFS transporter [Anaerobiospirillum sp. NML02-A-032]